MRRLLIANLDFEDELARDAGLAVPPLRPQVVAQLAALSERLRALGDPGDTLWTLSSPSLPPQGGGPGWGAILAWGESRAVAGLRPGPCPTDVTLDDWRAALWRLWPPADVAATCNHRGFAFALARQLGTTLPGARMVGSAEDVEAAAATLGAAPWVVKAPHSASGRHRLRHRGLPDASARTRIGRLLAGGPLLFEPWVDRLADVGVVGLIAGPERTRLFPPHRLHNDPAGVFRGIDLDEAAVDALLADHRATVEATATAAASALAAAGYRGPFGIDAYLWRDAAGATHLQPMSEINARLTFGLVERATAEARSR